MEYQMLGGILPSGYHSIWASLTLITLLSKNVEIFTEKILFFNKHFFPEGK
jgi:hypothetical protein